MATELTPNKLLTNESVHESVNSSENPAISSEEFDAEKNIIPASDVGSPKWKGKTDPFANPDGGTVEFRTMRWWLVHIFRPLTTKFEC